MPRWQPEADGEMRSVCLAVTRDKWRRDSRGKGRRIQFLARRASRIAAAPSERESAVSISIARDEHDAEIAFTDEHVAIVRMLGVCPVDRCGCGSRTWQHRLNHGIAAEHAGSHHADAGSYHTNPGSNYTDARCDNGDAEYFSDGARINHGDAECFVDNPGGFADAEYGARHAQHHAEFASHKS